MQLYDYINNISNKDDFIKFLKMLKNDVLINNNEWVNNNISLYLESICSWIEDMNGYYKNIGVEKPKNINWNFIALLLYMGKIYE